MARARLLRPGAALALVLALAGPAISAPAAPAFSVHLLDEDRILDSRALIGKKVVVLRFQGSWCKVCTAQAAGMQRLHDKYVGRDVELVGVHLQDTETDARAWRKRLRQTYPAGLDPGTRIATRFGFKRAPYTVVIDKKGEMVARIHGSADEARLAKILEALLTAR